MGHADDEGVRNAAANAFVMDRTAFRGPYYTHLEERMQEATRLAREHPDERVRAWAAWVSGRLSGEDRRVSPPRRTRVGRGRLLVEEQSHGVAGNVPVGDILGHAGSPILSRRDDHRGQSDARQANEHKKIAEV